MRTSFGYAQDYFFIPRTASFAAKGADAEAIPSWDVSILIR